MPTEKKSITLEKEIIRKIEELARKEGRSFSNMIQRILEDYLERAKREGIR